MHGGIMIRNYKFDFIKDEKYYNIKLQNLI